VLRLLRQKNLSLRLSQTWLSQKSKLQLRQQWLQR
jgi:hypothetical protein